MIRLKIVTLNTGDSMFEENQINFLERNNFDLICLQEITEDNFYRYKTFLKMYGHYQVTYVHRDGKAIGIGTLSKVPFVKIENLMFGEQETTSFPEDGLDSNEISNRIALVTAIDPRCDGNLWTIANIHFTWSANGIPNNKQRIHMKKLVQVLSKYESLLLCGDLNAPRGGEIFNHLAIRYQDNIPQKYVSSIDSKNHRAGNIEYLVDGIFSTREFKVSNFKMQSGLSDHLALMADAEK